MMNKTIKEKQKEYDRQKYLKNRDNILARVKKYREANPEKIKELNRLGNIKYKYKRRLKSKKWVKDNPERTKRIKQA